MLSRFFDYYLENHDLLPPPSEGKETTKPLSEQVDLSEHLSKRRRLLIDGNVRYKLMVCVQQGENYRGAVEITFTRSQVRPSEAIWFDFLGDAKSVFINDELQGPERLQGIRRFYAIDPNAVEAGSEVKLRVIFENKYRKDGTGLHSYIDPSDQKQYLYTKHEPFNCNKFFPCFDQPNIKGILDLTVIAPLEWEVISNEQVFWEIPPDELAEFYMGTHLFGKPSEEDEKNTMKPLTKEEVESMKCVAFKPTQVLSTYLYALCAGPYKKVVCKNPYKGISQTMYSREILFPYLEKN